MGRRELEKGKRWEREVVRLVRDALPGIEARRGYQRYGAVEADVEIPFLWVECKVGKLPNPRAALAQAVRDAPPGRWPIAVVKDDRQPPFVVLRLDDFLDLLGEWWNGR